jgi:hypothetical protein
MNLQKHMVLKMKLNGVQCTFRIDILDFENENEAIYGTICILFIEPNHKCFVISFHLC